MYARQNLHAVAIDKICMHTLIEQLGILTLKEQSRIRENSSEYPYPHYSTVSQTFYTKISITSHFGVKCLKILNSITCTYRKTHVIVHLYNYISGFLVPIVQ